MTKDHPLVQHFLKCKDIHHEKNEKKRVELFSRENKTFLSDHSSSSLSPGVSKLILSTQSQTTVQAPDLIHSNLSLDENNDEIELNGIGLNGIGMMKIGDSIEKCDHHEPMMCISNMNNDIHKKSNSTCNDLTKNELVLDKDGILNWKLFDHFDGFTDSEEDMSSASLFMRDKILPRLHSEFLTLFSTKDGINESSIIQALESIYKKPLEITDQPMHHIQYLLNIHLSNHSSYVAKQNSYIAFTILSTIVERFISSIFLTESKHQNQSSELPKTLSEILSTDMVHSALSPKIVYIAKTLIGPPFGLNIRNIIWHGFLGPEDFDVCLTSALFALYFSMCHYYVTSRFQQREWVSKPQLPLTIPVAEYDFGYGEYIFDDDCESDTDLLLNEIWNTISHSYFVIPGRERLAFRAFHEFFKSNNYFLPIFIILPLLEHCLRRIYVAVNQPTVNQNTICAESKVLFSTFDIITSHAINKNQECIASEGCQIDKDTFVMNGLALEIGEEPYHAVMDLILHYAGPRFRDRIAHCELNVIYPDLTKEEQKEKIPLFLIQRLLAIFLYLCWKYDIRRDEGKDDHGVFFQSPILNKYLQFIEKYISCFHSKSRLLYDFESCMINWYRYSTMQVHDNTKNINDKPTKEQIIEVTDYESIYTKKGFQFLKKKKHQKLNQRSYKDILCFFSSKRKISKKQVGKKLTDCSENISKGPVVQNEDIDQMESKGKEIPIETLNHEDIHIFLKSMIDQIRKQYQQYLFFFHENNNIMHRVKQFAHLDSIKTRNSNILKYYQSHHITSKIEIFELKNLVTRQQYLNNVGLCHNIIDDLLEFLQQMEVKREQLSEMIKERKARTPHRKLYAVIVQNGKTMMDIIELLLLLVDIEIQRESISIMVTPTTVQESPVTTSSVSVHDGTLDLLVQHKYLHQLLTNAKRLSQSTKDGTYGITIQKFCVFTADYIAPKLLK